MYLPTGGFVLNQVSVRKEIITIPTYPAASYDKNPMFLEKRVYQGSSGRVYPHPVCEHVSDAQVPLEYQAIYLENDYLLVMVLPELGGRIQRLYDKTNGYDAVYYNEVIKPALVGLAGPWISGGIEFNWPQHHRPSTYDPVDWKIEQGQDGSATVWVGETEKMFHTKGMAGFTLRPDCAYLEIHGRVYNPTDRPQTFLWWANPAVPVNEHTQSIFPPDVHAVMDHGKRAVSRFPIADGVYYKYDYAPGTDISRYKNIPVPTSYMAYHSDYDFIGNYDSQRRAGLLHIADHHISPGKKQWTWGCGDFGQAWDRNLTDKNGPYIELMTGVFTDNQPDFTFLKPYEEKTFTQYFMPYKEADALKNACTRAALSVQQAGGGLELAVYAPTRLEGAVLELQCGSDVQRWPLKLAPAEAASVTAPMPEGHYVVRITQDGSELLRYAPVQENEPAPAPAEAIPAPEQLDSCEKLFLAAVHLEQYRHATRRPEDYYQEGLRRDPGDLRLNNGYGRLLYSRGQFAESEQYFRAAIHTATWKNPNPYDCEPFYNLGLALHRQGKDAAAYDAFYKATWDGSLQRSAFFQLARLAAAHGAYTQALDFAEQSLLRGLHSCSARTLKTALLRLIGRDHAALDFARETQQIDPLDHAAVYESCRLTGEGWEELQRLMRGDSHNYIELALQYAAAGLNPDAIDVLRRCPDTDSPLLYYYLYALSQDARELELAEHASSLYCFPNRLEDMQVLQYAAAQGGAYAAYYLGCLMYDRSRWQQAKALWEGCAEQISLPTVWRNLALVYYNKEHNGERARQVMQRAFTMDPEDARVFFELDQLDKARNVPFAQRLARMEEHAALLPQRDDLYTEYISLLNLNGEYAKAYACIMQHNFHPWEGGEGKIPAQYRLALMGLARQAAPEQAAELLKQALTYPHSLGEGKLAGSLDNDLYALLGQTYRALGREEEAQQAFSLAARGQFDLSSAMYYNDQPPQMMYYAALAMAALGKTDESGRRYTAMVDYAMQHQDDTPEIDYFAVSLPDFLIFEADLAKNNRVHCCLLEALGCLGMGDTAGARHAAERGLAENCCQYELNAIMRGAL